MLSNFLAQYKVGFVAAALAAVITAFALMSIDKKVVEKKLETLETKTATLKVENVINKVAVGELKLSNEIALDTERNVRAKETVTEKKIDAVVAESNRIRVKIQNDYATKPMPYNDTHPRDEALSQNTIDGLWKIYCTNPAPTTNCN